VALALGHGHAGSSPAPREARPAEPPRPALRPAAPAPAPSAPAALAAGNARTLHAGLGNAAVARAAQQVGAAPAAAPRPPATAQPPPLEGAPRLAPGGPRRPPEGREAPAALSPLPPSAAGEELAGLDVPPSAAPEALAAARGAARAVVARDRAALRERPPDIDRPAGLPRAGVEPAPAGPEPGAPARATAAGPRPATAASAPAPVTAPPRPAPDLPPSVRAVLRTLEAAPEEGEALRSSARAAVDAIPTDADDVDTSAGPPPAAGPEGPEVAARISAGIGRQQAILGAEQEQAEAEVAGDQGEEAIAPHAPRQRLRARIAGGGAPRAGRHPRGAVPTEAREAFDVAAAERWGTGVGQARDRAEQARAERAQAGAAAHAEAELEIARAEAEATREQLADRAQARAEVAAARAGLSAELAGARATYSAKAARAAADATARIDATRRRADEDAHRALREAEEKAEARKRQAQADAEAEKVRRREESSGFWGWAKSKVKGAIAALRSALGAIFDALRAAVHALIDGAKRAAAWLIDQARRAIDGLLDLFEAALDLALDVALAAFPAARRRAKAFVHRGIAAAQAAVDRAADWLSEKVQQALDALGAALDLILTAYQKAIDLALDVVEFLVVGLLEILEGLGRLARAAAQLGDFFVGQLEEEGLGMNFTEPLPIERTGPPDGKALARAGVEAGTTPASTAALHEKGRLSDDDAHADQVVELRPEPDLLRSLQLRDGEEVRFGENDDPANDRRAILDEAAGLPAAGPRAGGAEPAPAPAPAPQDVAALSPEEQLAHLEAQETPHTCDQPKEGEPAKADAPVPEALRVYGPFTASQRARYMWGQIKKGIAQWWSCNKVKVLVAFALGALVALLLGILTGGAIFAAIPPLLELVAAIMLGAAVVRAGAYLHDYLKLAWGGDLAGGAKALARGFAILAIELVFALLFNLGAVIKAAKGGLKGLATGAARTARSAVRTTARAVVELGEAGAKAARVAVRNSRLVVRGLREGLGEGVKTLGALTKRFLRKLPFRGFALTLKGLLLQLWGYFNARVLLAQARLTPKDREWIEEGLAGARAAGKGVTQKARGELEDLAERFGTAVREARKSGTPVSKSLEKEVERMVRRFKDQALSENPVFKLIWEDSARNFAQGGSKWAKYLDKATGELTAVARADADIAKQVYAELRGEMTRQLPKYMDRLEELVGKLKVRVDALPASVQLHHLLPKDMFPELAIETRNLIFALRKVGSDPPELHDLLHWLAAGALEAGGKTRWTTQLDAFSGIVRKVFKL
jgi:hypothetical protein